MIFFSLVASLAALSFVAAVDSPSSIASAYQLAAKTSLPFPNKAMSPSDSVNWIQQNNRWSLQNGHLQQTHGLSFVFDPYPAPGTPVNTTTPVLLVQYPRGSYSHQTGGAQFYSTWNSSYQSVLLTYEVAFSQNFVWVKGGKLPGLRGGSDHSGCSGGARPNGSDCFSTRLMWRTSGNAETYAYVAGPNNLCAQKDIRCDPEFGISMHRGAFAFESGKWSRVAMLVRLNDPPSVANGQVNVYFDDILRIEQGGLQLRTSDKINSVGGLFFSTFFGGNDNSWATPIDQATFFRNFEMYGSVAPSDATTPTNAASNAAHPGQFTILLGLLATIMVSLFL
ncbi:polysaccharide lyase family 14 protein [Botryobasidium botryosum FD-172 SS1]|uniref:Polysaccharide lyase family 14 protein n=1 Tax=Botryobasidium botryosum (strain FD-172 SS1) TaxID=930990 RepID=A0A067NC89_BOTB1|nr:polysaccharide lyase family 14 protein [Botryobasidium botryosum FD-172 SS1]